MNGIVVEKPVIILKNINGIVDKLYSHDELKVFPVLIHLCIQTANQMIKKLQFTNNFIYLQNLI